MGKSNNLTTNYSSKIKKIFIELHNYSYFHTPSDSTDVDSRFIGRKQIIAKLKSLLTNSETKSGAYLVTGYRGMGKSSFVSKVLNEINSYETISKKSSRYFRIFFLVILMSLLDLFPEGDIKPNNLTFLILFPLGFFFLAFGYLLKTDHKIANLKELTRFEKSNKIKWLFFFIGISISAFFIISLLSINGYTHSVSTILSILFFNLGLVYLSYHLIRIIKGLKKKRKWHHILRRTFSIDKEVTSRNRNRMIAQDFYLASWIQILATTIIFIWNKFDKISFSGRLSFYLFLFGIMIIVNQAVSLNNKRQISDSEDNKKDKNLWDLFWLGWGKYWNYILKMARNYINYSNHVYVRISLGYDQLKEIDILRLVARGVHSNYVKKISTFSFPELSWKFAKFIIIYLTLGITYYYFGIHDIHQEIKIQTKFIDFIPSQTYSLMENEDQYKKILNNYFAVKKVTHDKDTNALKLNNYIDDIEEALIKDSIIIPKISLDGSILSYIRYAAINIDLILQYIFVKVTDNLPLIPNWIWPKDGGKIGNYTFVRVSKESRIFPHYIDYLFWMYFIIIWYVTKYLTTNYFTRIYSHGYIIKRLKTLNDLIDAHVTKNSDMKSGFSKFSFSILRQKTYPRADVREIEKQLLEILDDIGRIPRYTRRPEFIIIFDELDKVEPHQNLNIEEKEEEDLSRVNIDSFFNSEAVRTRQQNILKLLSNLKHFLTTAKSKFIFIAGREMFDASLADVADRNNFLGSIFNEVIYVSSFMKDPSDKLLSDITSMTETYVCQYLLPIEHSKTFDKCTLKEYNKYLEAFIFKDKAEDQIRHKIIFTLQQFITYLTYRSNGTPKKITAFFEEFIGPIEEDNVKKEDHICVANNSNSLYLSFNFFDQYTFGMATYLINPFFLSINKAIKDYGDKLLVSSSFLVDHLYKFHSVGFSWRNLELTPEIVDINKSPQLRELIATVIKFLTNTHIQQIDSGLYNFKFHRKISDEITLLSKISEVESAAFNFTLDESLIIKQHYKRKLNDINRVYDTYYKGNNSPEFIRSIGFINMILGDLHFYDEEYDNAILEYMEAVQLIGDNKFEKLSIESQVLFIRNSLKLGLTFEKKKTYDSAFLTFGKLASRVIKFRNVSENDININEPPALGETSNISSIINHIYEKELTVNKERLYFRFSIIENMRLIYQPLIARFQILEKLAPSGIQVKDITQIVREYKFLLKDIIKPEPVTGRPGSKIPSEMRKRNIAIAEFQDRVGDILYFKNGLIPRNLRENDEAPAEDILYCKRAESLCFENKNIKKILEQGFKTPCRACGLYMESLKTISDNYFNFKTGGKKLIESLLNYLHREIKIDAKYDPGVKIESIMKNTGNILSDIGDTFFSCSYASEEIRPAFLNKLLEIISANDFNEKAEIFNSFINDSKVLNKIEEALIYYYLSASFYRRASDHREYSFQFIKILYVIRDYLILNEEKGLQLLRHTNSNFIKDIKDKIVMRAIRGIYRTYESTHRIELEKYKDIFDISLHNKDGDLKPILANYSINWDLQEIMPLYYELKIMVNDNSLEQLLIIRKRGFSSPYSFTNSMNNRILQLKLQAKLNFNILLKANVIYEKGQTCFMYNDLTKAKNTSERHIIKHFSNETTFEKFIGFIIADSIFCLTEIIRSSKMFGISYSMNHSSLGRAHEKLADWCRFYKHFTDYREKINGFDDHSLAEEIKNLIGADNMILLAPHYHHEMALHHFRLAHETHREGKAYKDMISNMIYLNDDYNDNSYHFFAARERYRINFGNIYKKISTLKAKLKGINADEIEGTILYDIEKYF